MNEDRDDALAARNNARIDRLEIKMERLFASLRADLALMIDSVRMRNNAVVTGLQEDVDQLFLDIAGLKEFRFSFSRNNAARQHGEENDARAITKGIKASFDENELRSLTFSLDVRFGDLPGSTLSGKAEELVMYMERRGRLGELAEQCRELRPHLPWPIVVDMIGDDDEA